MEKQLSSLCVGLNGKCRSYIYIEVAIKSAAILFTKLRSDCSDLFRVGVSVLYFPTLVFDPLLPKIHKTYHVSFPPNLKRAFPHKVHTAVHSQSLHFLAKHRHVGLSIYKAGVSSQDRRHVGQSIHKVYVSSQTQTTRLSLHKACVSSQTQTTRRAVHLQSERFLTDDTVVPRPLRTISTHDRIV